MTSRFQLIIAFGALLAALNACALLRRDAKDASEPQAAPPTEPDTRTEAERPLQSDLSEFRTPNRQPLTIEPDDRQAPPKICCGASPQRVLGGIKEILPAVQTCVMPLLAGQKALDCLVKLRFVLGMDGRVQSLDIVGETCAGRELRDCADAGFRQLSIGPLVSPLTVTYPVRFCNPECPQKPRPDIAEGEEI